MVVVELVAFVVVVVVVLVLRANDLIRIKSFNNYI